MSRFSVIPANAIMDTRLSRGDVVVLAAIGVHADKNGWCFPSFSRIGEMLGITRQAVQKSVRVLVECGYVEKRARRALNGGQSSNWLRVLMDTEQPGGVMRQVAPPATSEVAPPATSEVAPPATSEVALTTQLTTQLTEALSDESKDSSSSAANAADHSNGQLTKEGSEKLASITNAAIKAFNESSLVKPNGGFLATVSPEVGRERRHKQVRRCLPTARSIVRRDGDPLTELESPNWWAGYWSVVGDDNFMSGRQGGGRGHENWLPSFDYLTREETMLKVYERVAGA